MQSEKVIREKGHDWMQENPVGTGPYKLVKWSRKQEHTFVRNDEYWGAKPHFKNVRVRIIPEQATQIAELMAGGVDIIKAVPPDQMDVINKSGRARTISSPILRTPMLQLDHSGRGGKNPFQDRRVRRAANLATDMDGIIKHVLNGLGDRTATVVNPMAFGWDPNLKPYRQDIDRAKKLLAEAGFPGGVDITFREGPPVVEPAIAQTNDAIVADLTKAGFRVKRNYTGDNTVLVARIKEGKASPMFNWSCGSSYFVCSHQAYKGNGSDTRVAYAVDETASEILTFNGSLIEPLYHSTCGGRTEDAQDVFGKNFPYVKSVESNCESSPYWIWERRIPLTEIEKALNISGIKEVAVKSYTSTKRVSGTHY